MLLGEFEYDTLETGFQPEDAVSKFFTLVLLVALIIFGTITMLNLFVGVVVSDIGALQKRVDFEVDPKYKYFMYLIIVFHRFLNSWGNFAFLLKISCHLGSTIA